ncbi:hypothetical protein ABZ177_13440 [Streptomyces sp. NPDC006284]
MTRSRVNLDAIRVHDLGHTRARGALGRDSPNLPPCTVVVVPGPGS